MRKEAIKHNYPFIPGLWKGFSNVLNDSLITKQMATVNVVALILYI